ncbi:DNA-binding response OmpR family regulator [Sinobaca qinghaiensis]|uniref:DNA-binding response OmpR family regulator n=1 Tax=Sinobaca qinghaiensis TaxID=342944 RepID=A0A419UZP3_9BACL|nr:response regulator transcription factor [Sinobaca qinghaiensis]RKD71139.1 DNA-binding response OmpR family regulator [Sinobaca qinghaiensis]
MQEILIIEDEEKLARVTSLELEYEGYKTEIVHDGLRGLERAKEKDWDLILLDVMLPGLNGMEILRRFRRENNGTPVILLTARDQTPDKVSGLDLGANDYMTKPFQIEELLARIRAQLRYAENSRQERKQNVVEVEDLTVNIDNREVNRAGLGVELTPREFDLLVYMMKNNNIVLTRDQLLEQVWGFDYYGDTNVVDVYIRYLRQKVDKPFPVQLIHTIRGVGYSIKGNSHEA